MTANVPLPDSHATDWRWQIGDELLAAEPVRRKGDAWDGVLGRLEHVARERDIALAKVRQYRGTAEAWPTDKRRHDISFTVHYILRVHPDRYDLIHNRATWTTRQAKAEVGWAITQ